jgi:hypothetical protein
MDCGDELAFCFQSLTIDTQEMPISGMKSIFATEKWRMAAAKWHRQVRNSFCKSGNDDLQCVNGPCNNESGFTIEK